MGSGVRIGTWIQLLVPSFCIHHGLSLLSQFPHHCSMPKEGHTPEITIQTTLLNDCHGLTSGAIVTEVPCPLWLLVPLFPSLPLVLQLCLAQVRKGGKMYPRFP